MALDASEIEAGRTADRAADQIAALRPVKIVLDTTGHVGAALRLAREGLGLAEDDIAQFTRVRAAYIAAIEDFDFEALPARPFVVGYVRAYAQALGLESEAVVARFHREAPKVDAKLRPPGGVSHDAFRSIRWLLIVGAVVAAAVVVWNVARRAELRAAAPAMSPLRAITRAVPAAGPSQIGAPLPTPPEATTPPDYQTPGLASPPVEGAGAEEARTAGARFVAAGQVYGAPASGGGVILQARRSTSLIVRGPGGGVRFARVLAPGESWRAGDPAGLTVEADDPRAVDVYVGGLAKGVMPQAQVPLNNLIQP